MGTSLVAAIRSFYAVTVVEKIGDDEGIIGEAILREVVGKLGKRGKIGALIVRNVLSKIRERIVALDVAGAIDISTHVSGAGHAFGVGSPGFAVLFQLANDIVDVNVLSADIAEASFVDGLAGGQHEIVADGRMGIGVVGSGYGIFGG